MASNLKHLAWKWAQAQRLELYTGAYRAVWDVVGDVGNAEMRQRSFNLEAAQAILDKHLARRRKIYENFLFELELQDSYDDPSSNEERRLEYVASCFRKPESKGTSPMQSFAERAMSSERGIGSVPDEEQWHYLFPRELEGNYEGLLAWANDYYAQAIETLERMKKEAWA